MSNRKDEIVEAASKRFAHYGYAKTTMNEIADDLRITKANLYYYYADKAALFRDVIRYIMESILVDDNILIDSYSNDLTKVLFHILERKNANLKKYAVIYLCDNLEGFRDPAMKDVLEDFHEKDYLNIKRLFEKAVYSGELIVEDVALAAKLYCNVIKGVGIMHTMSELFSGIPNIDKLEEALIAQKQVTTFILQGKIAQK